MDQERQILWREFRSKRREIHVLVVAPDLPADQLVSQDGVFARCRDPFSSQLSTADKVNCRLEFPALLPLTRRSTLFIRSSYTVIAEQALSNPHAGTVKYAVVVGTTGTNQSVFPYYMMWKLIKQWKRVVFFSKKGPIYF